MKPARFSEFRFLNVVTPTAGRCPRPSASMLYYNEIISKQFFDQNLSRFFFFIPGTQSWPSRAGRALCRRPLKRNPPPPAIAKVKRWKWKSKNEKVKVKKPLCIRIIRKYVRLMSFTSGSTKLAFMLITAASGTCINVFIMIILICHKISSNIVMII